MLQQLLIGCLVISLTIVMQAFLMAVAVTVLTRVGPWLVNPPHGVKLVVVLAGVVFWLVLGISVCCWMWACVFLQLGVLESLETALYFSIVTFTTLGYGDITLDSGWRLLSGLTATNGLIVFGLNTAFLVEFLSRLRHAQTSSKKSA